MNQYPPVYICVPTTKERRPRLQNLIESIRQSDYPNLNIVIHEGVHPGWVSAMHATLEGIKDDALIMSLGDDNTIEVDTISILVRKFLETFPNLDGYAQPYNQFQGDEITTAGLCRADMVKKYFFKGYVHNFSDNEFTEIIKSMGKHVYVPEAKVHHFHVSADASLQDETYASNQRTYQQDSELFHKRKANNFEPKNAEQTDESFDCTAHDELYPYLACHHHHVVGN